MSKTEGKNTDPSPMEHEVIRVPSRIQERQRVLNQGESMTMAELQASAAAAGVDTTGLRTKESVRDAIVAGREGAGPINDAP